VSIVNDPDKRLVSGAFCKHLACIGGGQVVLIAFMAQNPNNKCVSELVPKPETVEYDKCNSAAILT
jgi:hypothetical protein